MKTTIIDIPGIGPVAAEALAEHHITTVYQLSRSSIEKVAAVPGFSEARAARAIAAATELHGEPVRAASTDDDVPPTQTGDRKKKAEKDKGKQKGKGKDKKKGKGKDKSNGKAKGKGKGKGKAKEKKNRKKRNTRK